MAAIHAPRASAAPLAAVGVLLAASCASVALQPRSIAFPDSETSSERLPAVITTYPQALGAVLSVMQARLGFPPVSGILDLYPDRASLVGGLQVAGYDAALAGRLADELDGVATPGHILANDAVLRWRKWPSRIAFLAHEVTHLAEFALAGGRRGNSAQWLREGFAEWASWRVMDDLGLASYGARKRAAFVHMRAASDRRALPAFADLMPQSAWTRPGTPTTADPKYDQPFIATEFLIEAHGLSAVLRYFRLCADSEDLAASFRAAFGEDPDAFEASFQARLDRALR